MTPACMGGWCPVRDRCERHITEDRREVSERLCPKDEHQINGPMPKWMRVEHYELAE